MWDLNSDHSLIQLHTESVLLIHVKYVICRGSDDANRYREDNNQFDSSVTFMLIESCLC